MNIGVIKISLKENERRLPIYPPHLCFIDKKIRDYIILESGYGLDFKLTDYDLENLGYTIKNREDIFFNSDLIILPKPTDEDLEMMKPNQILWGWTHCVQNKEIAQFAINKKLTYISWENMNLWQGDHKLLHIFYKNNEIAGYASVLHVLHLMGMDGYYGDRKKVIVFGYGSVSKGAIRALHGRGFKDITVLSRRPLHLIADKDPEVEYKTYITKNNEIIVKDMEKTYMLDSLIKDADFIINGILQNVNEPIIFVHESDINFLKAGSIIIDISCDKGMGFEFARPTTFDKPLIEIGDLYYYSVDHAPSYLWRAASREISLSLMPFLPIVVKGINEIKNNEILSKAIDIDNGIIVNKDIISFQKRSSKPPYNNF